MFVESGLTAKPSKCEWRKVYLMYLGHRIGKVEVVVPEARVEAIQGYNKQKTRKDLRALLGVVSYNRKFMADFAKTFTCSHAVHLPHSTKDCEVDATDGGCLHFS